MVVQLASREDLQLCVFNFNVDCRAGAMMGTVRDLVLYDFAVRLIILLHIANSLQSVRMKGGSFAKTNNAKDEPIPVIVQEAVIPRMPMMPTIAFLGSKGKDGCPERFSRDSDHVVLCRTLVNHLGDLIHLVGKHPARSRRGAHVNNGLE